MLQLLQKRKKCIQVVIASLCVIICLHLIMSIVELEEHHSLTKGYPRNSATFVTALYDIKRDQWPTFKRSFREYLKYFSNILYLKINLVVFCDEYTLELLKLHLGELIHPNVYPVIQSMQDIEYEKYRQNVTRTLESTEFRTNNAMWLHKHPEAISADYILLMSNKLSFMKEAIEINPFRSSHFFWIDAGYGHGNKTSFQVDTIPWKPSKLLKLKGSITYILLLKDPYIYKGHEYWLHKMPVASVLNGAFFGGDQQAVLEYYFLYKSVFKIFLYGHNIVDDDQSIATMCFYERPTLFNLVHGGWHGVIKLFS